MKLPPGYVPGGGVRKPSTSGGFGETLLKRLGWKEGQGLGIEGQGISSFIKVHKKEDASGVCLLHRLQLLKSSIKKAVCNFRTYRWVSGRAIESWARAGGSRLTTQLYAP